MLGAGPSSAIIGVPEVKGFTRLDECPASGAWGWCGAEDGGPSCPLPVMGGVVAALLSGAALLLD